jgi:hypothetical protein
LSGRAQIAKLEVGRELLNDRVVFHMIFASQSNVIHKDRHENPNTISVIDVEPMVKVYLLQAHRQ